MICGFRLFPFSFPTPNLPLKNLILVAATIGVLVPLSACSSPEMKVKQVEDAKGTFLESSGYNACIAKVNARDAAEKKCETDELAAKGYTDGVDCTNDYNNPICKKDGRYNAEVDAYNGCLSKFYGPGGVPLGLSVQDCVKLLQQ